MKNASEEIKKMSEGLEPLENGFVKVDLRDLYSQNPKMLPLLDVFRTLNWGSIKSELRPSTRPEYY